LILTCGCFGSTLVKSLLLSFDRSAYALEINISFLEVEDSLGAPEVHPMVVAPSFEWITENNPLKGLHLMLLEIIILSSSNALEFSIISSTLCFRDQHMVCL
jgi:hypothetical protein